MSEYMDAPPPVYTAGPKNGTNGTNVSGCGLVRGICRSDRLNIDWVERAGDRRSPPRDNETAANLSSEVGYGEGQ